MAIQGLFAFKEPYEAEITTDAENVRQRITQWVAGATGCPKMPSRTQTPRILEMRMTMRPTRDKRKRFLPQRERTRIAPDDKLPLDLNDLERELILRHTFAGDDLTCQLRIVSRAGKSAVWRFTLGEMDELAGYVAAETNHAKDKKLKKHLAALFDRIQTVLEAHTDEDD